MPTKTVIAAPRILASLVLAVSLAAVALEPMLARADGAEQVQSPPSVQAPADVVFRNGDVYTMDPRRPWARGVAVRGGQIVGVAATDAAPAGVVGPNTRVVYERKTN